MFSNANFLSQSTKTFLENQNNTVMVSFPRCGSHWIRMMVELYFNQPTLSRNFFFPDRTDYILLATHDLELNIRRDSVLYLYRDPVAVVFSQINYYKEDETDPLIIEKWSQSIINHLAHWLATETFTVKKTIIRYERLESNLIDEFSKIVTHFDAIPDPSRILKVADVVTKQMVHSKVGDQDPQVIPMARNYADRRAEFKKRFGKLIIDRLYAHPADLGAFFS